MGHSWQKEQHLPRPCGKCEGPQEGLGYLGFESTRCWQQDRRTTRPWRLSVGTAVGQQHLPPGKQVKRAGSDGVGGVSLLARCL